MKLEIGESSSLEAAEAKAIAKARARAKARAEAEIAMSASGVETGGRQTGGYEHLSKKTRIELAGAANDHNYNLRRVDDKPSSCQQQHQQLEGGQELAGGHMDDCMAAMVLMFLSCRPNGQLEQQQPAKGECWRPVGPNRGAPLARSLLLALSSARPPSCLCVARANWAAQSAHFLCAPS